MQEETREQRELRLKLESEQMEAAERDATDNLKKKMAERYRPLIELLQSASIFLNNHLVDAKNAERYGQVMAIEGAIRRDGAEALGVAIAMLAGVGVRRGPAQENKPSGIILQE